MITEYLNWTIIHGTRWIATHIDGTTFIARTKVRLMTDIKEYEKTL